MFAEGYLVRTNALPLDPDVSPPPTLDALYNPTRRPDDTVDYLPLSEARLPILRWGSSTGMPPTTSCTSGRAVSSGSMPISIGSSGTCVRRAVRPGLAVLVDSSPFLSFSACRRSRTTVVAHERARHPLVTASAPEEVADAPHGAPDQNSISVKSRSPREVDGRRDNAPSRRAPLGQTRRPGLEHGRRRTLAGIEARRRLPSHATFLGRPSMSASRKASCSSPVRYLRCSTASWS